MKRREITIARQAQIDIENISQYTFEKWGSAQVDKYISKLSETIIAIAKEPEIGKQFNQFRFQIMNSHLIFYFFNSEKVVVARVVHKRSNWQAILETL